MDITITLALLAAVAIGVNEAVKKAVGDKIKKYLPLIAIFQGLVYSFAFHFRGDIFEIVIKGVIIGLMAVGLFENGKQLLKNEK